MKPQIAREYVFVERSRMQFWPLAFLGVFCAAAGFLVGDMTADRRFEERAASIIDYVSHAREDAERIRESLRRGCYEFVDPRSGSSKFIRDM